MTDNILSENVKIPKKRGRPPLNKPKAIPGRRGRKPKGGKIIANKTITDNNYTIENIIVHLQCNTTDINNSNNTNSDITYYDFNDNGIYNTLHNNTISNTTTIDNILINSNITTIEENNNNNHEPNETNNINSKIKHLHKKLNCNISPSSKSACFWCSYDFDNSPIHIPKYILNNYYYVYGNFCSFECAIAHLFKENINSTTVQERYNLFCAIYSNYKNIHTIKPAPCPYYTLNKYCGNFTISEYRKLFDNNRFLLVIDKPITHELPELHEEYV